MQTYAGLDHEETGRMTMIGRTIRDAWLFGLLPENDTFAGRSAADFQMLLDAVSKAWEPYGNLPSRLPPALAEQHHRIYDAAIQKARAAGWDPELADDD